MIDIITVNQLGLKYDVMRLFNELNETEIQTDLNGLGFVSSNQDNVILKDLFSHRGILSKKINIGSFFPKNIDLTIFNDQTLIKQISHSQTDMGSFVNAFPTEPNKPLVKYPESAITIPDGFDEMLVKQFYLFCRVLGFWELQISDVMLGKQDNKLTISVVNTHPIFTGTVEVTV
ncbi:hypothetical protein [Aeromonas phage ZPAH34]|uniref:hypothetical protein n=1 Tax=Aeromonas phage ZPAH34 TaxID=2924888 RepID=UPI002329077C|nr:hypothetical protein PQD16_gp082 [Aeromonas phage ZPAH34]UOX39601.1 hypothetical protein [Aeromonas phage ZPAH34]